LGYSIRPLRSRTLPPSEISTPCYKTIIDDYYLNGLVVVDFYLNTISANAYNVYSFGYGSLATLVKVVPPKIPVYLTYPLTTYNITKSLSNKYQWDYLNLGTNTQFTIYR